MIIFSKKGHTFRHALRWIIIKTLYFNILKNSTKRSQHI